MCFFSVISLQQYCDQIDQIEASVSKLEQTAYRLDNYAKQLGVFLYCFGTNPIFI